MAHAGNVYQLAGSTREDDWPRYRTSLEQAVASFRRLAASDRERIRDARVRVVDARAGEKLSSLLRRVDSAWSPQRTAAANDIAPEDAVLRRDQPVKVVRWEIYAGNPSQR